MNSASALLNNFNGLSNQLLSQFRNDGLHENQGKHLGHQRGLDSPQKNEVQRYEVSLSFSSSSISTHDKGVQVLEQELEVHFTGARSSKTLAPFVSTFEPPTSDDVVNNVLGFIENRIKQEASNGASPERLDDLLSQAREGVERGFGEALAQIGKIGSRTENLTADINQSFEKINTGLDNLVEKYVTGLTAVNDSNDTDKVVAKPVKVDNPVTNNQVTRNEAVQPYTAQSNSLQPKTVQSSREPTEYKLQDSGVNAGYTSYNSLAERAAIQITTRDGDIVSFNIEQIQASFKSGELSANRFGFESTQIAGQYSAGQYSYSIEGELDEGEIEALNSLMLQVEDMSDQFFSGDFQQAFQSAMDLGFDSQEIAGFTVNLSQTRIQQVSAYQQVADLGGSEATDLGGRFDPLSQFMDSLQAAFDRANAFSQSAQLVSDLFDRVLNDRLENEPSELLAATSFDDMNAYVHALLENMKGE